jgi:hypothetical protein
MLPALTAGLALAVPFVWSQPPASPAVPAQQPPAAPPESKVEPPPPPATPEEAAAREIDARLIELAKPGKDGSQVMANLTYLSDVIGPRLTGSDNLKRANEWTAEKMKEYGLSNVHLEPWTIPMAWIRGTATARLLEPDNGRTITLAAAGWSPGTKGKVEGDVVIVRASNKEELAKFKGKLKNAIVLRSPPARVAPISDLTFNPPGAGPAPGAQGQNRRDGANPPAAGGANPNARPGGPPTPPAERGRPDAPPSPPSTPPAPNARGNPQPPAAGGAQPPAGGQPPDPQFFRRNAQFMTEMNDFFRAEGVVAVFSDSGKPHGLLNMSGGWRSAERANAGEPIPSLYVTHDHYAMLWRLASRPEPAKTRIELEVTNKFVDGPVTVYNTVGEIRGSEKPDEFVVVGAHLDSWDLGQGTTDNGTGSCVVLETARLLSKSGVRPKRTIRFCLFTGEEEGLHGSRAYVEAHKDELARTSIAIVHDTGTGKVLSIGTQRHEALKPILERELTSVKALGVKEINNAGMGGSDHGSFDGAGVPGIMFRQDPAEYRLTHHSQSDTLDKAREPDLVQGAQVMSIFALRMANLDSLLPHHEARPRQRGAQ